MVETLYRFDRQISPEELAKVLMDPASVATVDTGIKVDLNQVDVQLKTLIKGKADSKDYDGRLVQPLHDALKHLPAPLTRDPRVWEWLAITRLPLLVWGRWFDKVQKDTTGAPADISAAVAHSAKKPRFLCGRSLRARAHNAVSRLYFAADLLHDSADGYKLVHTAFANQDRHTSIFERELGLLPSAAKAVVRLTAAMDSKGIQKTAKRLNHVASAIVLEAMSEQDLIRLLK